MSLSPATDGSGLVGVTGGVLVLGSEEPLVGLELVGLVLVLGLVCEEGTVVDVTGGPPSVEDEHPARVTAALSARLAMRTRPGERTAPPLKSRGVVRDREGAVPHDGPVSDCYLMVMTFILIPETPRVKVVVVDLPPAVIASV